MKTLNRVKSIIMALAVAVSISTSLNVSAESEYANIEPISYTDTESRLAASNVWHTLPNFPQMKQKVNMIAGKPAFSL